MIYQNHELKEKSSDNLVKHVQNVHRLYLEFQCMRFARFEIRNVPHEFCSKYSMNGSSNQEMCAMDMFGIDSLENT